MSDKEGEILEEANVSKKKPKRGIIYLSSIPPYMNVTRIREYFGEFGTLGRVYLQLAEPGTKNGETKTKKRKIAKKFTEGWVEFERKSVAKKVAQYLNNTQVSTRKKSKQYDYIWNIKYLSNFKWTHLHERLAYEKEVRKKKLRTVIQLAKMKANYFTSNLDKRKKNKLMVNTEHQNIKKREQTVTDSDNVENREEFLKTLFE